MLCLLTYLLNIRRRVRCYPWRRECTRRELQQTRYLCVGACDPENGVVFLFWLTTTLDWNGRVRALSKTTVSRELLSAFARLSRLLLFAGPGATAAARHRAPVRVYRCVCVTCVRVRFCRQTQREMREMRIAAGRLGCLHDDERLATVFLPCDKNRKIRSIRRQSKDWKLLGNVGISTFFILSGTIQFLFTIEFY